MQFHVWEDMEQNEWLNKGCRARRQESVTYTHTPWANRPQLCVLTYYSLRVHKWTKLMFCSSCFLICPLYCSDSYIKIEYHTRANCNQTWSWLFQKYTNQNSSYRGGNYIPCANKWLQIIKLVHSKQQKNSLLFISTYKWSTAKISIPFVFSR